MSKKLRPVDKKSYKSAITGKIVKPAFAKANPDTTYLDNMENKVNAILNALDQDIENYQEGSDGQQALIAFRDHVEENF